MSVDSEVALQGLEIRKIRSASEIEKEKEYLGREKENQKRLVP